jgi:uncharacterized protein (TIGR03067 family)
MTTKLLALTLLFSALTFAGTTAGEDAKRELAQLKGTWRVLSEETAGLKIPADPNQVFIFSGPYLLVKVGTKITDEFRVEIVNAAKDPKEMDLIHFKEPYKGMVCPTIYKIEGNKLTLGVNFTPGNKRPAAFTTDQANGNTVLTLEKVGPKQK